MKKMAEIMEEMGFRPDASDEVKKAFIKNLIKQANLSEVSRLQEKQKAVVKKEYDKRPEEPQQISLFDQKINKSS